MSLTHKAVLLILPAAAVVCVALFWKPDKVWQVGESPYSTYDRRFVEIAAPPYGWKPYRVYRVLLDSPGSDGSNRSVVDRYESELKENP